MREHDEVVLQPPGTGQDDSIVAWPHGPHYFHLTGSEGAVAWVRYRVWAADWHTRTLGELGGAEGSFDRLVGIEMALDGALNGLSSAFDAAVALLITAAEEKLAIVHERRLRVHLFSWEKCRELLVKPAVASDATWRAVLDTDTAMEGWNWDEPIGWLARLRRMRNLVAHRESLARHHSLEVNDERGGHVSRVYLDGRHKDAFEYLARHCDRVANLTETMIAAGLDIDPNQVRTTWTRESWIPGDN
jgi:hypothetical protein